jgi:plastocyanin
MGAQTYRLNMDHPSPEGKHYEFSAFYPPSVRVRPGDTVVFDNRSTQAIHTVTFGVAADRSNQPALIANGDANPVVFGPCYTASEPNPRLTACVPGGSAKRSLGAAATASPSASAPAGDRPAAPPAYGGQGYWNSGVVPFAVPGDPNAPPPEAQKATVTLSDSITPGSYRFLCLLHPFMEGTLEVVNNDGDRISPDTVARAGATAYATDEAAAAKLPEPQVGTETGRTTISAGAGDKVTSVNSFFPASVKVKAGDTVVWKNESAYEPHDVTFESRFKSPEDKGALLPGGVASGKPYPGGYSHSGVFGPGPVFPSDTFSLRFTKKGTYPYVCILHPGMGGVVEVE